MLIYPQSVEEADYLGLIDYLVDLGVLEPVERSKSPTVYIPSYDQAGFLNCLTLEQKSKFFLAAATVLSWLSPEGDPFISTYLEWPVYKKYGGHVRSLAVHWDALDEGNETMIVPLFFVGMLQEYAQ